ncbi:uroporphyrinogen-III synthase (plasmid) [Deinococcus sp. KNUC1210]|uniref:uroporphyrinogen-III synthase n=1 Tax=Deinococcus sp. KNUC1210 TaxID=2917691 RepID=UPI001EF00BF3|nr:uroporphyrinogen-III synthase [Deinococcus sp. KNUC1210]ULH17197.1 uroporphyrinogen-III synthase [Deinococcus sp. KNUC1210]
MDWFGGLSVLALETRRGAEMSVLIEKYGGAATVVPSMREDRQDISERLHDFVERVRLAPQQEVLVCMTGIGTRLFLKDLQKYAPDVYALLRDVTILSRGTKPTQALKSLGFSPQTAAKPHTYREVQDWLLDSTLAGDLKGRHVTILEYGEAVPLPLTAALKTAGAGVHPVPVYRCAFPEDPEPLRSAVRSTVQGAFQVLLLSSGTQAVHFLACARELGLEAPLRAALRRMVVASIGPACSEALGELRLPFDMEANPHKMGILVRVAAEHAPGRLKRKLMAAV